VCIGRVSDMPGRRRRIHVWHMRRRIAYLEGFRACQVVQEQACLSGPDYYYYYYYYPKRGPGWRIHGGVEDTKLSTNKEHSLSLLLSSSSSSSSSSFLFASVSGRPV
jgi:hypothetical protein